MSDEPAASVPRHLAYIPDGNRRWARGEGLGATEGHAAGIARAGPMIEAAWEAGVETVTLWWGSPANLQKRTPGEVASIIGVLDDWLVGVAPRILARHDATVEVIGRWRDLCPRLEHAIRHAETHAGAGPRRLVVLMAYDGRDEIRDAAARVGAGADEAEFARALWTGHLPPVDLVIRTGGEPHLSAGFLLWAIAEAQLHFVPDPWPAMTAARLDEALAAYAAAERRHGR